MNRARVSNYQRITDAGLAHLRGLSELEYLSLTATRVSDAGLDTLRGMPKLSTLNLPDTVTDGGVKKLAGHLPNLEHVAR